MTTPIYDFVKKYAEQKNVRIHMPGHKGKGVLKTEELDITEIDGAQYLYDDSGIIRESEAHVSALFSTRRTFYGTEGSSQMIKTMVCLLNEYKRGDRLKILASRNAHKSFIYACALVDVDVVFIDFDETFSLLKCNVTPGTVERYLTDDTIDAVYLTNPDYLGNILDISSISVVCKKHNVPLVVDNAHGAYLKFLNDDIHPITLGADMCCDSAHKTLGVLTGGAYLHISKTSIFPFEKNAKSTMELFGSTSPSFLTLCSLDKANEKLSDDFAESTAKAIERLDRLKSNLTERGYSVLPSDPLRLTIYTTEYGYTGDEISSILSKQGVTIEYHDENYVVGMFTCFNDESDFERVEKAFLSIKIEKALITDEIKFTIPVRKMTIRDAFFSESEYVDVENAVGRILSKPTSQCPPCISIGVSGEQVDRNMINVCKKYKIDKLCVVKG